MDIVETVAKALCDDTDDNWDWSVFYIVDARDNAETGRDVYRSMARAAIRATLEHYRDNVSEGMIYAGLASSIYSSSSAVMAKEFRAILSQALKELDRSEALDELGRLDGELM